MLCKRLTIAEAPGACSRRVAIGVRSRLPLEGNGAGRLNESMASRESAFIDITPQVLLKAYSCGIFPMAESAEDSALYWIEPQQRGILLLDQVHVPRRLARTIRQGVYEVRVDTNFEAVIEGCATPSPGRRTTWINRKIRSLYRE